MDNPYDRTTTLPGLRQFFDTDVPRPESLSFADYLAMDSANRDRFDEARLFWWTSGMRIRTFALQRAHSNLARVMRRNRLAYAGRGGLIVSGPPVHGKTDIALSLARRVEKQRAHTEPDYRDLGEAPVVMVDAPSNGSGKALMAAIAEFFHPGIPVPSRWTTPRVFDAAMEQMRHAKTRLLIIDEAHRLAEHRNGDHGDPTDMIKEIQNQSTATVVLVGVNLESTLVFGTPRGKQVLDRCDHIRLASYTRSTDASASEWRLLVESFDLSLPLCGHEPGLVSANSAPLLDATAGCLGELAKLMGRLVSTVVDEPDRHNEVVTPERLADVIEDYVLSSGNENRPAASARSLSVNVRAKAA